MLHEIWVLEYDWQRPRNTGSEFRKFSLNEIINLSCARGIRKFLIFCSLPCFFTYSIGGKVILPYEAGKGCYVHACVHFGGRMMPVWGRRWQLSVWTAKCSSSWKIDWKKCNSNNWVCILNVFIEKIYNLLSFYWVEYMLKINILFLKVNMLNKNVGYAINIGATNPFF